MKKKLQGLLLLGEEARLYDSYMYVFKAFLAVILAYFFASQQPLLKKDIISILFGLMMTLEPVTLTGIKSGISQLLATILGAAVTAVLVILFGINIGVIGAAVALTVYVGLKVNWRFVSPVAIFTAIYMTQYVQQNLAGENSMLLTFRLRIIALAFGVAIAIITNFIFSLIFYKDLKEKRMIFLVNKLLANLINYQLAVEKKSYPLLDETQQRLPELFNQIDWLSGLSNDLKKERQFYKLIFNPIYKVLLKKEMKDTYFDQSIKNCLCIREATHLLYDSCQWIRHNKWVDINATTIAQINECIDAANNLVENEYVGRQNGPVNKDNRLQVNHHNLYEALYLIQIHE